MTKLTAKQTEKVLGEVVEGLVGAYRVPMSEVFGDRIVLTLQDIEDTHIDFGHEKFFPDYLWNMNNRLFHKLMKMDFIIIEREGTDTEHWRATPEFIEWLRTRGATLYRLKTGRGRCGMCQGKGIIDRYVAVNGGDCWECNGTGRAKR